VKLAEVMEVFHAAFADEGVRVAGGYDEPFYRAARGGEPAEIRFNRDYLNSCLHEIAHWCIAGKDRRGLDDYGYWYRPDGRNGAEQREFFRAEAGPQALEWCFALACGEEFRMSLDNLGGEIEGEAEFAAALEGKLEGYLAGGFPARADRFLRGLLDRFHPDREPDLAEWLRARRGGAAPAAKSYSASSRIDSQ
jgi:elongation factor P hydroxylase